MNESDDFLTHVGLVNRECERFQLNTLTIDQFKSLIFICSLQSPLFADIRLRLLNMLEQDPKLTLNSIAEEYQRLANLKHDTTLVQSGGQGGSEVHAVQSRTSGTLGASPGKQQSGPNSGPSRSRKPPAPCWHCGAWHFVRFCPFKQHRCRRCNRVGHKEEYCQSKRPSALGAIKPQTKAKKNPKYIGRSHSLLATFQINAPSRRKFISVHINGRPVRMQLDTASDITIISEKLWHTLGRPPVRQTAQTAISACGGHLKLIGKLECCVSFRGKTFSGPCYVTNRNLNLLGVDWFENLGLADIPINMICNHVNSLEQLSPLSKKFAVVF